MLIYYINTFDYCKIWKHRYLPKAIKNKRSGKSLKSDFIPEQCSTTFCDCDIGVTAWNSDGIIGKSALSSRPFAMWVSCLVKWKRRVENFILMWMIKRTISGIKIS